MRNIVLAGDSIFDNGSYTGSEPPMLDRLKEILPPDDDAFLLAVDGSVTLHTIEQLAYLPDDATHIIVSTGGNDGLRGLGVISSATPAADSEDDDEVPTKLEPLEEYDICVTGSETNQNWEPLQLHARQVSPQITGLAELQKKFKSDYRELCIELDKIKLPVVLCTVYTAIPRLSESLIACISFFNDVIIGTASDFGFPVLDIRKVCTDKDDYSKSSPIEPSSKGSKKIAADVMNVINKHDFSASNTVIYPGKKR